MSAAMHECRVARTGPRRSSVLLSACRRSVAGPEEKSSVPHRTRLSPGRSMTLVRLGVEPAYRQDGPAGGHGNEVIEGGEPHRHGDTPDLRSRYQIAHRGVLTAGPVTCYVRQGEAFRAGRVRRAKLPGTQVI